MPSHEYARQSSQSASMESVLMETDAAKLLSLSVRTLQRYRVDGGGPAYIQLGERRVGYCHVDLEAWLASRRRASTSAATVAQGEAA